MKLTIKGLNYFISVYLYRKITMLRYRLQVMTNTADHYNKMMINVNKTNNQLREEIEKIRDYNLNSRKKDVMY